MDRRCKFGDENVSNTLQNVMLTMFQHAHLDARTDEQDKTIKPPATLRWAEA